MRILLIDDDQVDRAMVRRALKTSGLAVELAEASDGTTGIKLADAQSFDCVLLDYRLPDIDAFDVLKAILASEIGNHAVIMLTGEADQDVALRLMSAGALDYLSKAEATPSNLSRAIRYATARRRFLSELETSRREAEEKSRTLDALNKQQHLLFSIIAHDLRNPFQGLLGSSALMSRAVARKDLESITRLADGISKASNQAYTLMESLFTWASLQMDTVDVIKCDIDLGEVANEVLNGAAETANSKGLSLTSKCNGIRLCAHRDMLVTVLRNLVSNAIKFTPQGGAITIEARQRHGYVEVAVADTGVGMADDRVADIFMLDRRMTTIGTAGEKGSGLGLLLCRDLTERQGGKLLVESTLDRGTTFYLNLPMPGAGDTLPAAKGTELPA